MRLRIAIWQNCDISRSRFVRSCLPKGDDFRLRRTGDQRLALGPVYVDLRSYAKAREVQPRFDRETRARQEPPIVVRLVVVEMHAVAVNTFAQAVPGAVEDIRAVARTLEHVPR